MLREKIGLGRFGECFFFLAFPSGLQAQEFGDFAFAAAGEAVFLEMKITQFLIEWPTPLVQAAG